MRDDRCVGVRRIDTGEWYDYHRALGTQLLGSIGFDGDARGVTFGERPKVGQKLVFSSDILTSTLQHVTRPSKDAIVQYGQSTYG